MILQRIWKHRRATQAAEKLYRMAVRQSRLDVFYTRGGVSDTFEGRFELLSAHLSVLLYRLKVEGAAGKQLSQAVVDLFFADMDAALRELGVGDMSIAKRVRAMSEAFYGRLAAYDAGIAAAAEPGTLEAALRRNLYDGNAPDGTVARMAAYLSSVTGDLAAASREAVLNGSCSFPAPGSVLGGEVIHGHGSAIA